MLLGIPGDNTYANFQEASRTFWRQTVLPLVNRTARAFSAWLAPSFGAGLEFKPDLDQIEALSSEREALWARLEKASFLTDNEKRAAFGYGPVEGGGELAQKFNPYHDEAGRFTTAEGAVGAGDGSKPVLVAQVGSSGKYTVSLAEEEACGGHTLRDHVGKSDEELLGIVERSVVHTPTHSYYKKSQSSFLSRESANDFVNLVLDESQVTVDLVARGTLSEEWLEKRFGYPTGKEAFRPGPDGVPYMRKTYNVGVLVRHDPRSERGYRVHTAYPLNEEPRRN